MKQDCPHTDGCLSWMIGIPSGFVCKIFHLKKGIKKKWRREVRDREEEEGRERVGKLATAEKTRKKWQ